MSDAYIDIQVVKHSRVLRMPYISGLKKFIKWSFYVMFKKTKVCDFSILLPVLLYFFKGMLAKPSCYKSICRTAKNKEKSRNGLHYEIGRNKADNHKKAVNWIDYHD